MARTAAIAARCRVLSDECELVSVGPIIKILCSTNYALDTFIRIDPDSIAITMKGAFGRGLICCASDYSTQSESRGNRQDGRAHRERSHRQVSVRLSPPGGAGLLVNIISLHPTHEIPVDPANVVLAPPAGRGR